MKIAVCVKQVPDSWAEKKMADGVLDRPGVDAVLNDLDEYAVEEALRIVEAHGGNGEGGAHRITIISMGPARAVDAARKALSMGADSAVIVTDPALAGSDALATSRVLAQVIAAGEFDLVLCGTESTDARMSVIPAMLAQRLGWASLTFAGSTDVNPETKSATITRDTEVGLETITAKLPAVISVIEKINEPRYPSFKGIMAAKKKSMEVRDLASVGVSADLVGSAGAWSAVVDAIARPARTVGIKIVDDGNAGTALVNFLVERKLI
jgi:electron transfer flavoprotein beta subunit